MMGCEKTRIRVEDWLDGTLIEEAAGEVRDHLAFCVDCRDFFDKQRQIQNGLVALGLAADAYANSKSRYALTRQSRRAWFAAVGVAAAIALVVLLQQPADNQPLAIINQPASNVDADRPPLATNLTTTIHFPASPNRMVVPMKSDNPRVHIVWLYDTVVPADEPENSPQSSTSTLKGA